MFNNNKSVTVKPNQIWRNIATKKHIIVIEVNDADLDQFVELRVLGYDKIHTSYFVDFYQRYEHVQ